MIAWLGWLAFGGYPSGSSTVSLPPGPVDVAGAALAQATGEPLAEGCVYAYDVARSFDAGAPVVVASGDIDPGGAFVACSASRAATTNGRPDGAHRPSRRRGGRDQEREEQRGRTAESAPPPATSLGRC